MEIHILFKQHYAKMYRAARSLLYDGQESEDVVSDIFEDLLQRHVSLQPGTEEAYLMKCVRNRCLKRLRHEAVRKELSDVPFSCHPVHEVTDDDFADVVDGITTSLPEQDRRIFSMRFHEGYSYEEIALREGISRVAVWRHLSGALTLIRNHYKK